jgi:hypothetical protein
VTFTLAQGSAVRQEHAARTLVRAADACGGRSLVKPAGACLDTTTMPLEVRLAAAGAAPPVGAGELYVFGTQFRNGQLELEVGDIHVKAVVTPLGVIDQLSSYRGHSELRSRLARVAH